MLRTALASRLPTAEWSSGRSFSAPSSGKIRMAECGETIRDACAIARVKSVRIERAQVLGLPVVAAALGLGGVEQHLLGDVRSPLHDIADRRAEGLDRREHALGVRERARIAHEERDDGLAVDLLGQPRGRRRDAQRGDAGQLAGRLRGEGAIHLEDAGSFLRPPGDRAGDDVRPDRVQRVLEAGGHPEVAAAAAQPPEQVGVLALGGPDHPARRRSRDRPRPGCRWSSRTGA